MHDIQCVHFYITRTAVSYVILVMVFTPVANSMQVALLIGHQHMTQTYNYVVVNHG